MKNIYIHPFALVESTNIGNGTKVWAYAHIMKEAHIGKNCNIGDHCFIENSVRIGNDVTIKNGNMIWEGVTIEDGVFLGPNVLFANDVYPRSPRLSHVEKHYKNKKNWLVKTLVKKGASIGTGAIILGGVLIGEFSMVAAGAVVTENVLPHGLYVGHPAKLNGWVCKCGLPLKSKKDYLSCSKCKLLYKKKLDLVKLISG